MRSRARHVVRAGAALVAAVGCRAPPAPIVTGVEPDRVVAGVETPVTIRGANFFAVVRPDFDAPERSEVAARFLATIISDAGSADLIDLRLLSETEIAARVPASAVAGTYALELTDPRDRTAQWPEALTVDPPPCATDGTRCDDARPCTRNDACAGGACRGEPGCDAPPDACFEPAGTCGSDGTCVYLPRAAGAACAGDGNACTVDACDGQGVCLHPNQPPGTPCDDRDACTAGETCDTGICGAPTSVVACRALDACHVPGVCDPATGACSNPQKPDGTPCEDGDGCTMGETCKAGVCGLPTSVCLNTAPRACLTVTPTAGTRGPPATKFDLEATCSSDREDAPGALEARFDFEGDGLFDTAFSTARTASVTYAAAGWYAPLVEVRDRDGLSMFAARYVSVAAATDDLVVTTAVDEADVGATPALPGGAGFSLREAIDYANLVGGAKVIRFAGPMTIRATGALPALTGAGASIVGRPGVVLDFGGVGAATCVSLRGSSQRLVGVEVADCAGTSLVVSGTNAQVAECGVRTGRGTGVGAQLRGSSGLFGPRNDVSGFLFGIKVMMPNNVVDGNRIHANVVGVDAMGPGGVVVQRNFAYANTGAGIDIANNEPGAVVRFNTLNGNGSHGVRVGIGATATDLRSNLFTNNGGYGVSGGAAEFAARDPNGLFANALGAFSSGAPSGASVLADPLYVAPASRDYRLTPFSPAVNRGVDLGLDVNGPRPTNFDGSAPDLGASESPY